MKRRTPEPELLSEIPETPQQAETQLSVSFQSPGSGREPVQVSFLEGEPRFPDLSDDQVQDSPPHVEHARSAAGSGSLYSYRQPVYISPLEGESGSPQLGEENSQSPEYESDYPLALPLHREEYNQAYPDKPSPTLN